MVNLAYIDETTFELEHKHRDASADPGTSQFAQWIKTYSRQINGQLGVPTDIGSFGDDTHATNDIVDVIAVLLEARYVYYDDLEKTPLTERGSLEIPHIKMDRFGYLRADLEELKGQIPTIASNDPPAFNFDLDTVEGGFD